MPTDARKPRLAALAAALAVGLASFVIVAWGINEAVRALAPEPDFGVLNPKLRHLEQHAGAYDTIFVGSSRIHFHVDPEVFDAEMARLGCASRSFNMGVHALNVAQERYLLRRLAKIGQGRWARVLIERPELPSYAWWSRDTDQQYYFMTSVTDLWLASRSLWTSPRRRRDNAFDTAQLIAAFLSSQLGGGQLGRLLAIAPRTLDPEPGYLVDLSRHGFVPVEREINPGIRARAERFDHAAAGRLLATAKAHDGQVRPLTWSRSAYLWARIAEARQVAPEVALIVFPEVDPAWVDEALTLEQVAREGGLDGVALVNLGDPRRHPEFFDERLWYEDNHLIAEGAAMLSSAIARELCPGLLAGAR